MMKEWLRAREIAGAIAGFPPTESGVLTQAAREQWRRLDLQWPANKAGIWRRLKNGDVQYRYSYLAQHSAARRAVRDFYAAASFEEVAIVEHAVGLRFTRHS